MNPTTQTLTCPECEGTRRFDRRPCLICAATGTVTIDPDAIRDALISTRGHTAGRFRRSRPKIPGDRGAVYGAAYVWRMIRFHSGLDMCLPITAFWHAGLFKRGPVQREVMAALDELVARFGTEMMGAAAMMRGGVRWAAAFNPYEVVAEVNGRQVTTGELADALGVTGLDGLDIGGFTESPEAVTERLLGVDGQVSGEEVREELAAQPRPE